MKAASTVDLEVSQRLPLADASLRLLDYALDDAFLSDLFERHRGRCFEVKLTFCTFVHLMADALLHHASAHRAFCHGQEQGRLTTTVKSMYDRLSTVPCDASKALLREGSTRLNSVRLCVSDSLPSSLADYQAIALDGKKLKYVAKRLKVLRGLKGNVLGGKLLVAQDMATRQAVAMEVATDGEAADNPLVAGLVEQVRALPSTRPRLWVADRGFSDYNALPLLAHAGDAFLVRFHCKCKFVPDPTVASRTGKDELGRTYREEWGWLGGPHHKKRMNVRQITVERPDGEPLVLVTNLLDADRHPATDLLLLYRRRWGIETMFQRIVQTYDLRTLIGGTPQATVFQAAFCLLLYNITLIVRDYVAEGVQQDPETISLHHLHTDLVEETTAWMKVIGPDATPAVLAATAVKDPEEFRSYLKRTLGGVWTKRLTKSKTTKRPPKQPPRAYLKGGHSSVDRIQRGVHKEIKITPRKSTP